MKAAVHTEYTILTDILITAIKVHMEKTEGEWLTVNAKTDKPFGSIKTLLR